MEIAKTIVSKESKTILIVYKKQLKQKSAPVLPAPKRISESIQV